MNQHGIPKAENGAAPSTETTIARAERDFLHDLSNPLAIAGGLLELLNEDLLKQCQLTEQQKQRLAKLSNSLDRIQDLIKARRMKIIEQEDGESRKRPR